MADEELRKLEEIRRAIKEKGMAGIEEVFGLEPGTMGGTLPPGAIRMDAVEQGMKGLTERRDALIKWFKDTAAESSLGSLPPGVIPPLIGDFMVVYMFAKSEGCSTENARIWAFEEVKKALEEALKKSPWMLGTFETKS